MKKLGISFDFWGTLCTSNPAIEIKKLELISKLTSFLPSSGKYFISQMKKEANAYNDAGLHLDRHDLFRRNLITCMKQGTYNTHVDIVAMANEYFEKTDMLFREYPPVLNVKKDALLAYLQSYDAEMLITSNTVLTYGEGLDSPMFSFINDTFGIPYENCVFSDELGISKPHPMMWKQHYINNQKANPGSDLVILMHVGDSDADKASVSQKIPFVHIDDFKSNFLTN